MGLRNALQADASQHTAAIARWDDEGGAPISLKIDQAPCGEAHILECLGAAVIRRWAALPTRIQRDLFEHATSLADLTQKTQLKGQIARFLHNRKDDGRAPRPYRVRV
jgi:hypothetical protein